MHFSAKLSAGTQTGEGADQCALAYRHTQLFTIDMGERVNHGVGSNGAVGDKAVGSYPHAVTQID